MTSYPTKSIDITHRIETLERWIDRVRGGDTPAHLIWPAFVVDENGQMVRFAERVRMLSDLGIEADISREPDVLDFADELSR